MKPRIPQRAAVLAALLILGSGSACAQQGTASPDIAQVRAATAKLINLLVEQGVLTQDKAAALLQEVGNSTAAAASPPGRAASAPPVRVQYVPDFVRKEIKDEVRAELAAQAQKEGWAGPFAVPPWTREIKVDGDLRARYQLDNFDPGNAPAVSINDTNRNRALTLLNTTEDRHRLRVRARLGVTATVDENWSAGVRLTTGSATDPLSSNQTLGVYNNRYTVLFDRAYLRYRFNEELNAVVGRFGNPWFGSELLWANDLGFDGAALQWTRPWGSGIKSFVTLAALPVQEVELSSADKWLFGAQVGAELPGTRERMGARVGLGYYRYNNLVGQLNAPGSSRNDFTAPAFAQKGNTYFNISSDPNRPLLALASDYRLLNLTAAADIPVSFGKRLFLTGDFVKNLGFDRAAVAARVGTDVEPKTKGYLVRMAFGSPEVTLRGDWQVFTSYRRVERDAVLDAFTDSDFRLGGTDVKGISVGGSYGLGRNSALSVRYLSGDSLSGAPLSIDVFQIDVSVRF